MTETELRERLARMAAAWFDDASEPVADIWGGFADAALQEIAAEGFVLIERGVLAKLLATYAEQMDIYDAAFIANHNYKLRQEVERGDRSHLTKADWDDWQPKKPGDLDALPERTDGE